MKIFIGNDIVDLSNPDIVDQHKKERFINRVLDVSEREELYKSDDPKKMLWLMWSGKEAAYKVLKKILPTMVFSHSKIVINFEKLPLCGSVQYGKYTISLRWNTSPSWIHCVAVLKNDEKNLDVIEYDIKELTQVSKELDSFNSDELLSIYSSESAGVRNLTKKLLKKHLLDQVQIIRLPLKKKFSPPELYLEESSLKKWDLSMSHDGKYVSCAISKHR